MGKCLSCFHPHSSPSADLKQADSATDTDSKPKEVDEITTAGKAASEKMTTGNSIDAQSNNSVKLNNLVVSEKATCNSHIPSMWSGEKRCSRSVSENKINHMFERYKDPHEDAILSDGIERLCRDLEVRPEEFIVLVLAWKFGAEQMCRFTHKEFLEGCKNLKVDSIQGIRYKFPEMLNEVQDSEQFKDLYRFTYKFGLEEGQRILPAEMAVQLWRLVFSLNQPPILQRWLCFLELHPHIRGIPRDTWNMFLNFCETVGDDLSIYDDTEAWPSLFDDFVEYENDQTNQNIHHAKSQVT